jgi:hypothetical protein
MNNDTTFDESYDIPINLKNNGLFTLLFEIERNFWKSTGRNNSNSFSNSNLAETGVMISPADAGFWVITSRDNLMKIAKTSPPWTYCKYKNIEFKSISDDIAMLFYNIEAKSINNNDYGVLVCTTFKKYLDSSWKIISTHHTMPYTPGIDYVEYKRIIDEIN